MEDNSKSQQSHTQRWQRLRSFNIAIISSFIFFFIIGIGQSYTAFDSSPAFHTPIYIPLAILLLALSCLFGLIHLKDNLVQTVAPVLGLSVTLFVTINSHLQEQAYQHSFLYLVCLLPLFYSYLFAYSNLFLVINNIFLVTCYILASILGETDALVFLFNCAFLFTLCYLTIFTQFKKDRSQQSEQTITQTQKKLLNTKSSLYLNHIIHDIRQPLSSLSLYSHLLETKLANSANLKLAENIKQSSEQLDHWLSNLLDLARLDAESLRANISEFELSTSILPIVRKYQYQASTLGIRVRLHLPEMVIKGDTKLLSDIADTLISNAITHGAQDKGASILISARKLKKGIKFEVWNQGEEIDPALQEHLFDEVAHAENPRHNKSKGIGLGLAIAQRKAALFDTKIVAKTTPTGSRFSLMLVAGETAAQVINIGQLSHQPQKVNVLLIDDDPGILSALSMLLENWGYNIDCAETAEEGLKLAKQNSYALFISDYRLPGDKNGLDIIQEVKQKQNIPAVLLTGEADPGKLKDAKGESSSVEYKVLHKPVKPASLRVLLRQLLS